MTTNNRENIQKQLSGRSIVTIASVNGCSGYILQNILLKQGIICSDVRMHSNNATPYVAAIVREPVERVLALYGPDGMNEKIGNEQTEYFAKLAGIDSDTSHEEKILKAKQYLSETWFVGIYEYYHLALQFISAQLGLIIDCKIINRQLESCVRHLEASEMQNHNTDKWRRICAQDYELWKYARKRFLNIMKSLHNKSIEKDYINRSESEIIPNSYEKE